MRIHHVLDRVRNDVTRWQTVEHAVVPHGNAVIDCDGVEFFGNATGIFDFARDQLS